MRHIYPIWWKRSNDCEDEIFWTRHLHPEPDWSFYIEDEDRLQPPFGYWYWYVKHPGFIKSVHINLKNKLCWVILTSDKKYEFKTDLTQMPESIVDIFSGEILFLFKPNIIEPINELMGRLEESGDLIGLTRTSYFDADEGSKRS